MIEQILLHLPHGIQVQFRLDNKTDTYKLRNVKGEIAFAGHLILYHLTFQQRASYQADFPFSWHNFRPSLSSTTVRPYYFVAPDTRGAL